MLHVQYIMTSLISLSEQYYEYKSISTKFQNVFHI
jgi:hypothetical protein